jgi:hypothetical protein
LGGPVRVEKMDKLSDFGESAQCRLHRACVAARWQRHWPDPARTCADAAQAASDAAAPRSRSVSQCERELGRLGPTCL